MLCGKGSEPRWYVGNSKCIPLFGLFNVTLQNQIVRCTSKNQCLFASPMRSIVSRSTSRIHQNVTSRHNLQQTLNRSQVADMEAVKSCPGESVSGADMGWLVQHGLSLCISSKVISEPQKRQKLDPNGVQKPPMWFLHYVI